MIWGKPKKKKQTLSLPNLFGLLTTLELKQDKKNLFQFGLLINFSLKASCPQSQLNISSLLPPKKKKNLTETFQNFHLFSRKVITSLLFAPRGFLNIILCIYL